MIDSTIDTRINTIEYILTNYSEIFSLTPENKGIVATNLSKMSDIELKKELDILGDFFTSEKHIYQRALFQSTNSIETLEKEALSAPVFSI